MTLSEGFNAARGLDKATIVPLLNEAVTAVILASPGVGDDEELQRVIVQTALAVYGAGYERGVRAASAARKAMEGEDEQIH